MPYFIQFSTSFYIDIPRICLHANVCYQIIVVCVNCLKELIVWLINWNFDESYTFLNIHNFVHHTGNCILGLGNFKFFLNSGGTCPWTLQKKGTNGPLLILSLTLIKPSDYFNNFYWNPWNFFSLIFRLDSFYCPLPGKGGVHLHQQGLK